MTKILKRPLSILLAVLMIAGVFAALPLTAYAAGASYVDGSGTTQTVDATELASNTTSWTNGSWYIVPEGGLTISGRITVNSTVNLILRDGAELKATAGITLSDGATLNIYAQSAGTGAFTVNGSNENTSSTVAGSGTLVLNGGTLTATGGDGQSLSGTLDNKTGNTGGVAINGTVTVSGGTLAATGGNGGSINGKVMQNINGGAGGAAISGAVTINSGTLAATGGNGGSTTITAFGQNCKGGNGGAAIGGAVTINGGTLTATKGDNGTLSGKYGNAGTGGAGYDGTLTLGAGVKLYEGTDNTGTVLDGNDSASRVYEGEKKANMYAELLTGPDKTDLNTAITAAETLYDSIKDDTNYSTIASTLKNAIDAAKEVADSETADQDAVDTAKTAITDAKTTAETAKKNIDDTKAANAVIEKINALPPAGDVTASDKAAIEEAREAYDKLTDDQKEIVNKDASILLYLQAAEEALAALPEILDSTSTTWTKNATITDNLTIDDKVTVTADITLTIPEGKTLTVNGGIDAGEYTVTVAGKGVLVVTGTNGTEGTNGTSNGGAGSDGFKGNIIVDGATVTVTGGNGGNVTGGYEISGSNGGNGGNGVAGNITVNSGSATVTGGNGGTGGKGRVPGSSGSTGIAVTGTIKGPTVEESADNSTWTKIESGASSTKKYIKVSEATAEVVKSKIDALPNADEVTIEDKTDIQKARDAYDALDDTEKDKIDEDTLKKLTDAEDALAAAEASDMINALPSVADITTANKEAVEAARKAYDDLTDAQEAYVSDDTLKKLTDAESALEVVETIAAINALPEVVKATDKNTIEAARAAYNALTADQKAKVDADILKKLTDAEKALEVTETITSLPAAADVAATDKTAIEAARTAYNALTADQKAKVDADTLKKLTDAESALTVVETIATVNALPAAADVTTADKDAIEAARAAYDALTNAQKENVPDDTLKKLTDAEDALAAAGVSDTINALPAAADVTTADKDDIEAARAAYDALTNAQKGYVSADTLKNLTDAEDALAAAGASDTINALPAASNVTTADKDDIEAARAAYDALTNAQKGYVSADTLKKLTDAEDALAAAGVSDTINALPAASDVTTADKDAIKAARKAYNDLTDDQKGYVSADTLKKLTDAEEALEVAETVAKINALPASDNVKTTDKADIEAARKSYDDLTDDQKAKVSEDTLKKLTDAESALEVAETVAKINALPAADDVKTTDKTDIEAARTAYDALTADQKAKVDADTLKKLTDAETALAAAEKKAAEEEQAAKELAAAKTNAQKAMNNQVTVTQKGKKITVKWSKSTAADGYQVFAQYCGKKTTKPVKTIKKNTTTKVNITKINGKKINLKKQFKVFVKAYKVVNGKKVTLAKSIVGHVVGVKNAKYTNVKSIKVTKSKLTVKVGKTAKVKVKVTLVDKNKKHIPKSHAAKFRYRTSNKKIATVTKSGKIKGIKKGTCTIYVYAINGKMKKVKVTVK